MTMLTEQEEERHRPMTHFLFSMRRRCRSVCAPCWPPLAASDASSSSRLYLSTSSKARLSRT
jgi:predicted lipoprotein with Yx(FWY)xxD motif